MGEHVARRLVIEYVWVKGPRVGIHVRFPDGSLRSFAYERMVDVATRPMPRSKPTKRRPLRVTDRWAILERDSFTCRYCGRKAPDVELVVDHIHPVAEGGTDDPGNLVTACVECNAGKGARIIGAHLGAQTPRSGAA